MNRLPAILTPALLLTAAPTPCQHEAPHVLYHVETVGWG